MGHPKNRAERRAQRERIIRNRHAEILDREKPYQDRMLGASSTGRHYEELVAQEWRAGVEPFWYYYPGKFHKYRPYSCPRKHCYHCHFSKIYYPKEKRLASKKLLREAIDDYYSSDE